MADDIVKVACPGCQQQLRIPASLLGKRVKCPKCQKVLQTKARSATAAKPVGPKSAAPKPVAPSSVASKPVAQKLSSVKPVSPAKASAADRSGGQAGAASSGSGPAPSAVAGAPAGGFDFGSLPAVSDLASAPSASGAGPVAGFSPLVNHPVLMSPGLNRVGGKSGSGNGAAKGGLARFGFHFVVVGLALVTLVVSLLCEHPLFIVGVVELVLAAIVVGLLFVPRLYLMKRVFGAVSATGQMFAQAAAGIGTVGVATIVILAVAKGALRMGRKANSGALDFSGMSMSGAGAVVGGLLTFVFVVGMVIAIWYLIGIARAIAVGYLLQCAFMLLTLSIHLSSGKSLGRVSPRLAAQSQSDPFFDSTRSEQSGSGAARWQRPDSGFRPGAPSMPGRPVTNPFRAPPEEVVQMFVERTVGVDMRAVQDRLIDGAPKSNWRIRQTPPEMTLWIRYDQPIEVLQRWIEENDVAEVLSVDPERRILRLKPRL